MLACLADSPAVRASAADQAYSLPPAQCALHHLDTLGASLSASSPRPVLSSYSYCLRTAVWSAACAGSLLPVAHEDAFGVACTPALNAVSQQERRTNSILLIERTHAETSGNELSSPLHDAAAPHIQDATVGLHAARQLRDCSNHNNLTSNAAVCRKGSHCLQNKEVCNAFSTVLASLPPLPPTQGG